MTFQTVLVDDEPPAVRRLARLLEEFPSIEVVGTADSGPRAVEEIEKRNPDLVFLDIDLPGFDAFEVLRRLEQPPVVIFTTGYDRYALQAFEATSVDYLVKPIEPGLLRRALGKLERLTGQHRESGFEARLESLLDRLQRSSAERPSYLEALTVQIGERALIVKTRDITHFYAKAKYVYLHTVDGKDRIVRGTLAEFEKKLDPKRFVRVHRGSIVNVDHIREIQTWFGGKYRLVLRDAEGSTVTVSKGMASNLRAVVPF